MCISIADYDSATVVSEKLTDTLVMKLGNRVTQNLLIVVFKLLAELVNEFMHHRVLDQTIVGSDACLSKVTECAKSRFYAAVDAVGTLINYHG